MATCQAEKQLQDLMSKVNVEPAYKL